MGKVGFYDLLGLARDASGNDIKKAFKKAALAHHPDKGGDTETFQQCQQALETLSCEHKRASYDRSLARTRATDGLNPAKQTFRRQATQQSSGTGGNSSGPGQPPSGAVEIPSDPSSLSVRELKDLLSRLNVRHDDCLEKSDLLARLQNRKTPQPRAAPPTSAATATNASAPKGEVKKRLRLKIISLGAEGAGKSCIIKRFCESRFVSRYISTIGVDYGVKNVDMKGKPLQINFFDMSGNPGYREIREPFYAGAMGVLLTYDVASRASFDQLEHWIREAKANFLYLSTRDKTAGTPPFVVLVANKVDQTARAVSTADGQDFAALHGMQYLECSCSTGKGVNEAMSILFRQIVGYVNDQRKALGIPLED